MKDKQALGITCISIAMLIISLQDAMVKQFHAHYALHEIMLVRASVALMWILAFVLVTGAASSLRTRNFPYLLLRGLMLVIANSCFFLGIAAMPIAENVALFFVAPLIITGASSLILKERVGPRRWSAVCVGLVGVAVVVQPTSEVLRWEAFLPITAAAAYACMQLMARRIGRVESAATMVVYMQLTLVFFSLGFGSLFGDGAYAQFAHVSSEFLLRAWTMPDTQALLLWFAMGTLSAAGSFLMTQSYRVANAALIATFEYIAIPFSVLWGYYLYAEVPNATVGVGIALILASGIYIGHREFVLARLARHA
jgi:drug/metabolite transporter (DMT)-like permease